jgi:hypothetical protein
MEAGLTEKWVAANPELVKDLSVADLVALGQDVKVSKVIFPQWGK